ncbi:MAG: hypothetical protein K0S32_2002 [Bacteroidetes bacterium]|jgi:hypothetical protein|nr:hypothetical protein [Bacteroidota bacterium]
MRKISPLTDKMVCFKEIPNFNSEDCVTWAYDMLQLGYDSPSLVILAGFNKPLNYFEVTSYLTESLDELNIPIKEGEEAVSGYLRYLIREISLGNKIKDNLYLIVLYVYQNDLDELYFDFLCLNWAWGDITYGYDYTDYWPGANKNNINSIVQKVAGKWMEKILQ